MADEIVIDATNALLGRLASYAAKQALLGKKVVIVGCDDVVISGAPRFTIGAYKIKRIRGGSSLRGPHFPRSSERIVKRTVKGMLPHHQTRGLTALRRVMCFSDIPEVYRTKSMIKAGKEKSLKTLKLKELTKELS